ncbi:pectin lyase fold/virulence factor [Podospora australis]|uniref:Pectin lyase fold/virulence factor n=1 Tax=Podospora australis TaxID=1536484 RepID=A0AAN7ABG8_9PEZI|nr:pectin lyase fold/virulence factor [Podospora australis]
MRAFSLLMLATAAIAATVTAPTRHGRQKGRRQNGGGGAYEQEHATYDDACNIGFCSVWGATIGGWGAEYQFVKTLDQFSAAVSGTNEGVIIVDGTITGDNARVEIGSSKSIVGTPGSSLTGITLSLNSSRNVIVRNLKISKPPGDAIVLENARSIWIDHNEISSVPDGSHLLSITRGSDYTTVTHNRFFDFAHPTNAAVSVGHSDNNAAQDQDKLHVTFARNHFSNVTSAISFRYGTGHLFNSLYEGLKLGIETRTNADLFVESSIFNGPIEVSDVIYTSRNVWEIGYASAKDLIINLATYTTGGGRVAPDSLLSHDNIGYPYDWYFWETSRVKESVAKWAGQTLEFLVWE